MITSSPCSRKAVKTEYWPEKELSKICNGRIDLKRTLIGTTSDKDVLLYVQLTVEQRAVDILDRLPQPDATLGVRVVVRRDGVQRLLRLLCHPLRRREVHVALPEVNAVRGEVRSAEGT